MRTSVAKLVGALTLAGAMLVGPGLAAAATGTWTYSAGPFNVEAATSFNIAFFNFSGSTQTIAYAITGTQPENGSFPINDGQSGGQSYTCTAVGQCTVNIVVTLQTSEVSTRFRFVPDDETEQTIIPPGAFLVTGPTGSATNGIADLQTQLGTLGTQLGDMQESVAALATQLTQLSDAVAAARTEAGVPLRQCKRKGDGTLVCKSKNVFIRDAQQ